MSWPSAFAWIITIGLMATCTIVQTRELQLTTRAYIERDFCLEGPWYQKEWKKCP